MLYEVITRRFAHQRIRHHQRRVESRHENRHRTTERLGRHAHDLPAAGPPAFAERTLHTDDGATIRYLLVEPDGGTADTERSVLIALPPGNQQRAMAEWGLRIYSYNFV